MKITEAIAALLGELTKRGDVDVSLTTPSDRCDKHPSETSQNCSYCDLCAHGMNRNQDCRLCHANDDESWRTAPVSDVELDTLVRFFADVFGGPSVRETPHSIRNYHVQLPHVRLMPMLAAELRRYRSQTVKRRE